MIRPSAKIAASLIFLWGTILSAQLAGAQVLQQTFTDTLANFKISTPDSRWIFEPRGMDPGSIKLTMRFESPLHQFVPNVNVRVFPLADPEAKLNDWIAEELKNLPEKLQLVEKKQISHRGMPGYEIQLKEPERDILFRQWFFLSKGQSFVITCTAKSDSFPRMTVDFDKILKSFEII